jgi:DNA-directed RNA polymerase subunit beta'
MSELSVDATFQYMLREIKRVYSEQGVDIHNKHIEIIISQMLGKVEIVDPGDTDYMIGDLVSVNEVKRENERLLKNNAKVNDNRKKALNKRLLKHVLVKRDGRIDEIAKQGDEITSENLKEFIDAGIKDLEAFSENIEDKLVYQINMKNPVKYRRKLLRITKASLKREGWLSAASFQQTSQVLTESALKASVDELLGVKENVIIGQLVPAGTGMDWYSGVTYEENVQKEKQENVG